MGSRKHGYIIKVNSCFVERAGGRDKGKLCDTLEDAHRWHYKEDAKRESIWWMGTIDGKEVKITVEKV